MGFRRVDWFCPRCGGWWPYGCFDPTDDGAVCPHCTGDWYRLCLVKRESPYWTGHGPEDDDKAAGDGGRRPRPAVLGGRPVTPVGG
jgi:hypothetical protein